MATTITLSLDDAQEAAVTRALAQRFHAMPPGILVEVNLQATAQEWVNQLITVGVSLLASDEDAQILKDFKAVAADPAKVADLEKLFPTKIK